MISICPHEPTPTVFEDSVHRLLKIAEKPLSTELANSLLKQCYEKMPSEDETSVPDFEYASDAARAVIFALQQFLASEGDVQNAVFAAQTGVDVAFDRADRLTLPGLATSASDAATLGSEAVQKELALQRADLDALAI